MLKNVQWHRDFRQVLEREELELLRDPERIEKYKRVRSEFRACWRQRYVVLPAEKWLERVEAIEREAEPCEAMILHQAL